MTYCVEFYDHIILGLKLVVFIVVLVIVHRYIDVFLLCDFYIISVCGILLIYMFFSLLCQKVAL